MTMTRNQLRAARILLCLSQDELAALSSVGVATIRRYETGTTVSAANVATLRAAVEAAGAVILEGQKIGGRPIGDGVALASERNLPPDTLRRLRARLEADQGDGPRKPGRPRKRVP